MTVLHEYIYILLLHILNYLYYLCFDVHNWLFQWLLYAGFLHLMQKKLHLNQTQLQLFFYFEKKLKTKAKQSRSKNNSPLIEL